ncbi:MAG TPA: septum site-determining protein MinC [Clostridiaceae bacterium]|jgi:septum site-determining protein MinC|nr:probable septum site-determining protein MinC [Clostridium sp. CAG:571]HJJ06502.1 septum site-determining protein MinC [Clostridiaceae bacterium]HJJ13998.1 septum site-determining protein MinC [Clostridiaceae bacterium]
MKNGISIITKENEIVVKINEELSQKEILDSVKKKIAEIKKIRKENDLPLFITGKNLSEEESKEIEKIIKDKIDIQITFDIPKILGLHGIKKAFNKEIAVSETKFHRGALRSGQRIEYEGSLVVLGDVNAGAEVIAGENIVVLGILRGLAHAGAKGNKEAIIAAASIEAPQIRISNIIKERTKAEIQDRTLKTSAYIDENGEMIIE